MSDQGYPVSIAVRRPDGSVEQVRVGTAFKSGEGFLLKLEMTISGTAEAARPASASAPSAGAGGGGLVFPNYGRSKGQPIYGASQGDLEFYANGCRRTLNDQGKARWHDKERALLAAIEAEMSRQGLSPGGGSAGGPDGRPEPPSPDDIDF